MPRQRVLITDFSAGMVSKKVIGRIDIPYQQKAVEELRNFVIAPDGGVHRRHGTFRIHSGLGITPTAEGLFGANAIPGFQIIRRGEAGSAVPWLIYVEASSPYRIRAINLRTGAETFSGETSAVATGKRLSVTQTYYNDPDAASENQEVRAWTHDAAVVIDLTTWAVSDDTAREIAAVFENRLIGIDREWGVIWSSIPLDLDNFNVTEDVEIPGSDPVAYETINTGAFKVIPDFYGVESPQWVIANNGLYFGTDKGEYQLVSGYPYLSHEPGGAQVQRISTIGSDGATISAGAMILRNRDRLIRFGGNQSATLTDMIENSTIIEHLAIDYGGHQYLVALDLRGDVYCRTENLAGKISGWTKLVTGVSWIAEYEGDLYIARDDGGTFVVELLPLDSLANPGDRSPYEDELFRAMTQHADGTGFGMIGASSWTNDPLPPSTTVTVYKLVGDTVELCGDWTTNASGDLVGPLLDLQSLVGYAGAPVWIVCHAAANFDSYIKTLPVNIPSQIGTAFGSYKHIGGVVVIVHESGDFKVRVNDGPWETWETETLYSGPVTFTLESAASDTVQVEVQSIGANPLNVMSIEVDVTVGVT